MGAERIDRTAKVLLIDDADITRRMLAVAATLVDGIEVVGEAGDGLEGLRLAQSLRPDGIILDVEMPVMDGLQALPAIRAGLPDAVVLVFTSEQRHEHAAMMAGADRFFTKDTSPVELFVTLADLVGIPARLPRREAGPTIGEAVIRADSERRPADRRNPPH